MKILLALALLISPAAHAAALGPQSVNLTCDALELAPGNTGHVGKVTLALATDGKYINSRWTLSVIWKGVDQPIIGAGSVCGVAISDGCFENTRSWVGGVFSLTQACGIGGFDTHGLPHHTTDVNIVLAVNSAGVSHGRFSCAAHDVGNFADLELSNCK
jgi:hypothetical protein